ncbi:hypothetical protein NP233_g6751 [Leucocoprinus birnbaumii]|uniref:Chorismate mutase n=1 Tax=Leucocoprinus birnbaumii TaxID=56174 RepID=A0AAD5YTE0_9AGAR|nr:hypothetical protein NP233_g6751 [Leucocoprinus birnbaumii]
MFSQEVEDFMPTTISNYESAACTLGSYTNGNIRLFELIANSGEAREALAINSALSETSTEYTRSSTPATTTSSTTLFKSSNLFDLDIMSQNFMTGDPLSLDSIRSVLGRLEDTIIFGLIERAQFAHNPRIYQRGAFKELEQLGFSGSWLEWFLKETEIFHAKARRYTSPDQYPFTPASELPKPVLPPLHFPDILFPNDINANKSILSFYTRAIVPRITRRATLALAAHKRQNGIYGDGEFEDDGNYGSAATIDVEVLQAISKRVHYGKFVSESKFISNPAAFIPHIQSRDREALEALITKPEVERKLLVRLQKKVDTYSPDITADGDSPTVNGANGYKKPNGGKIDTDGVVELYESYIIPLTKEVEVDYLLRRLDGMDEEMIERLRNKDF